MKTDSFSNQLRWVILLLAAAVILPTVCLLWFMNQAVENEHLAVSTKLSNILNGEVYKTFEPFLEWVNSENLKARKILSENDPFHAYSLLSTFDENFESQGVFIYDIRNSTHLYPLQTEETESTDLPELRNAIHLEFVEKDLNAAFDEYTKIAEKNEDTVLFKHCAIAMGRIYQKQGDLQSAIIANERALAEPLDTSEDWRLYASANLKLLYLLEELGLETPQTIKLFSEKTQNLLYVIDNIALLSCEHRIFFFEKAAKLAEKHSDLLDRKAVSDICSADVKINLLRQSLQFLSEHPDFLKSQSAPMIEKVAGSDLYALNLYSGPQKAVRLMNINEIFEHFSKKLDFQSDVLFRILDTKNNVIVGPATIDYEPFLRSPVTSWLDFTVEFYDTQKDSNIFLRASQRQATVYLWTGFLMVAFVLSAGAVSIRAVNRQIQMNRLKNDFIATVTHELKTPLSSMRLLVDTLLDGNYRDEQTVPEYLGLIANENKRLSHLIDSFLTFSRMERNKQVFDFKPVSPVEIAKQAAEAVHAKFDNGNVNFAMDIQKALPMMNADKDGMITVLVNLLDNAYKYSNSDKHIQLNVYQQNGFICFAIKDNGIGISKRAQKRIFNRFYQVDSRLSRTAEGCGLGLSIVKFIVDAHKGTIEVESQPGQGSTFTVRLPKS